MYHFNSKKYFLRTLIIALSFGALIGIFIFLAGDFGRTEVRLLLTTLAIGCYSLTGLCSTTIQNRDHMQSFSLLGIIISAIGFLITTTAIWDVVNFEEIWKATTIFIILSVSIAHISLLFNIRLKTKNLWYMMTVTIIFISIVALMLINSTISEFKESEFYFRLLGVFSILDVLGTIATPILNNICTKKELNNQF
ncbi:hypothetical protein [Flavobacterium geliluteum]|uniref:Uncharacterized protein n=1 Tax=Flavobacterium geliluteum TaxID=2816120 RepID=A0A940X9Y2_9FLAO|nr:hypothetical protein [Flavobacterium geliluteum]MBP4138392.1 hypothetical protein [Flavobacterium geliluteum]